MYRFIRYLVAAIFTIIGGFVVVSLLVGFVFFGDAPQCDSDSEAAHYVRSLSSERLEKLHKDMEKYFHNEKGTYAEYFSASENGLPKEFSDLWVVRVSPSRKHIMIVGCFDNYMFLHFSGIEKDEPKEITLQYGEHEVTTEVIWSKQK